MEYNWITVTRFYCLTCNSITVHETTLPSFFNTKDLNSGENHKKCLRCGNITEVHPVPTGNFPRVST